MDFRVAFSAKIIPRQPAPASFGSSSTCSAYQLRELGLGNAPYSIKIIGNETDNYAQGYFVYDSKSPAP